MFGGFEWMDLEGLRILSNHLVYFYKILKIN